MNYSIMTKESYREEEINGEKVLVKHVISIGENLDTISSSVTLYKPLGGSYNAIYPRDVPIGNHDYLTSKQKLMRNICIKDWFSNYMIEHNPDMVRAMMKAIEDKEKKKAENNEETR